MVPPKRFTDIYSSDFDGFVADVAAEIWNKMIDTPNFHHLKPRDYAGLFEAVSGTLTRYRREKASGAGRSRIPS